MKQANKIVDNEVYSNVSMLINELSQDTKYADELYDVLSKPNYRDAVEDMFGTDDATEAMEWLDLQDLPIEDWEDEDWENMCNEMCIDPYYDEALEHWIVSDWLAEKLEQHGEMVIHDFMGLTIWGRTTSGQHISLDYVIQKIAQQL